MDINELGRMRTPGYLLPMATAPKPAGATPPNILDLGPAAARNRLTTWAHARGLPRYRVDQIFARLWQRPVASWQEVSDLPKELRAALEAAHPIPRLALDVQQTSQDGTKKFLWRLPDGEAIESVLIPSGARRTLCISSQCGCALAGVFSATGTMGFRRNLTPFAISGQVREIVLRDEKDKPTNIVFMGMGEPLLNWPAVDTALTT